ncbi:gluconate 2-dehydrogenase subunit 3 family protein [Sandaracinobacteroides hominis]|uniref:gluconate 2-dehydrogenase subunit 3 family protein n=1 Tax=Sandaracinobacteroides hominis TaxID=2780086 RepID=UPI0018F380FF|nr:gluconate 2-dehydrogenase subunit 3 family protein [Sandaracinobacteroides hominis]
MIDRRDALAGMAAMFGAAIFPPIARAGGFVPAVLPQISTGAPSAPVFTASQRALMTQLSERVMPTTDTPGAIAAEVPAYIEKLLADWSFPEERKPIIAGLDAMDAASRAQFGKPGTEASAEQLDALLTQAMNDKLPGGSGFFEPFRQMVLTGYFTSEIGITQEREYLPVPGGYNGAYPVSEITKVFSS